MVGLKEDKEILDKLDSGGGGSQRQQLGGFRVKLKELPRITSRPVLYLTASVSRLRENFGFSQKEREHVFQQYENQLASCFQSATRQTP